MVAFDYIKSRFEQAPPPKVFSGHQGKVHSVGWNCTGSKIASGSIDKTARVWQWERSNSVKDSQSLKGHTESVDQLRWDPTHPEKLATASIDKTVRIWDTRSAKTAHTISTPGENINICWSPDAKHLAVGNKEDVISFVDARQWKIIQQFNNDGEANEIGWNLAGTHFIITTGLGTVRILDWPTLTPAHTMNAHTASIYCFELDSRGRYLALGSADAIVSVWDTEDFVCIRTFTTLEWPVRTLSFAHDGEVLAAGSEDQFIDISHIESGQVAHRISVVAATNTLAWHPTKWILAYAGDEEGGSSTGSFRLFNASSESRVSGS
ncbi:WD40-repeat-containing domain protein [Hyaloraphidium curvatum]|nr:WD40-repeat-containing domain protein [Hyaloraphidium curvatum]